MRLYNTFVLIAVLAPIGALAQSNPLARAIDPASINGSWNGADLERRTNCASPQNNGQRGTYAEYYVVVDKPNAGLFIDQTAITGLRCTYAGTYLQEGPGLSWTGTLSCSDGKRATFRSQGFLITPNEISIRLTMKLEGTETCDIDAILGGSRL
jgi:hypothetical protein